MDYRKTAKEILNHVGGSKNIVSAAHCATRLRLVIADNTKADKTALENVDGVKGVFEASGQLQIILGTGTVNKVFDEFIAIAGITASTKAEAKDAAAEKQNWFMKAIKLLGDIFVPIIPAIVASGFLMGIMNALDFMNSNGFLHISTTSSIYVFATLFSNIAYTFLQILIAFSAAKAFGANPYLGAVIGMIMIHPSLQNAYTVATEGVQQTQSVFFGLYHIDMVGYQGHVIPVVIAVWILSVLEKKLHKIVPEVLDLFVTPLVSVFVTGYLTLSIVGPIFVWAENAILGAIQWMLTLPLGLGSLIMGSLYAPTVVTGIHQMYTAIDIGQLAKYGVTYWLPLASAANVAQGAAALAVAVKSKDQKIKSLALPSSLSAFMGITEPAIFGVNLRFFKPFIAGCIGGGCGALYASLVHLGAKGTGVTGIFGILNIRENTVISSLKKHKKAGFYLSDKSMEKDTAWAIDAMHIKTPSQKTKIRSLSGGNQQKVILGRWLLTEPEVLMLDEPTRGIDVGAKYEIYQLIIDLANKGKVVLMVSSEMPELLGVCDRILVMSGGKLAGEVDAKNTTQEEIMSLAAKYV